MTGSRGPEASSGSTEDGAENGTRILVTNDDGIHATGIEVLTAVAARLGDSQVVAPDRQQSASSHSLTLHRPLRVTEVESEKHVVDGTPTDCVLLAVNQLLERVPEYVVSGVNHGPNMGEDVLYSGTVAAAMEGTILGIPSIAVSFVGSEYSHLGRWEEFLTGLIGGLIGRDDFPDETFFNINLPDRDPSDLRGVRVTSLGRRVYSDSLSRAEDPQGRDYYWIGGGESHWSGGEDSDFRAVRAGYASVTPLHLDLTNHRLLEEVRSWALAEDGG